MQIPKAYRVKTKKIAGTQYAEVFKKAMKQYSQIEKRTKRRTYLRSIYFKKEKIFLGLFWHHLHDKHHHKDKIRRLKYFPCAMELIQYSSFAPVSKQNVDKSSEILHRFTGITAENEIFFVQIKENKNNKQKFLISVFPLL